MKMTVDQCLKLHLDRSLAAGVQVGDHGGETSALWAIAQAIHDHAQTSIALAETGRVDAAEIEALGQDVSGIANALNEHREAVEKVMKGLSPWGALKASMDKLERALQKVLAR